MADAEEADEVLRRAKTKNVMYRPSEKTGGEKPVDLIRATRPILIVDEPQSVDGGLEGVTSLGLKEAKDLVDNAPGKVKEGLPKEEAEKIKKELEESGATVELA